MNYTDKGLIKANRGCLNVGKKKIMFKNKTVKPIRCKIA